MRFNFTIWILGVCLISCDTEAIIRRQLAGEILEGKMVTDSSFHGKVNAYSLNGKYLGYTNYWNGYMEGASVRIHANGLISDSITYKDNCKNGYAYKFDTLGRLEYKMYYFYDKAMGPLYQYDKNNRVVNYAFLSFDGGLIFQYVFHNGEHLFQGDILNVRVNKVIDEGDIKDVLFLYLVYPPSLRTRYELGILDSSNTITSSSKIEGECFYMTVLDSLPIGYSYALLHFTFNEVKNKEDLEIAKLESGIVYGFNEIR
ncbi:MAG TPA: hypothetical protein VIK89_03650 [Cytophagaceae bacterium]